MSAGLGIPTFENQVRSEPTKWQDSARKAGLFALLLPCSIAVFVLGSNYYSIFPTNKNLIYEGSVSALLLAAALLFRFLPRMRPYWQVTYAFFVAESVILVTSLTVGTRDVLLQRLGIAAGTNQEMAVGKVFEALVVIVTILLLSRLAGMRPGTLFVKRGNLRWGLILGFGLLVNFASSAVMFFYGRFTAPELLLSALLWGLIFSLANGFLEELWLRSQFLGKLEPLLGPGLAIFLTALWWSLFHAGAVYFTPIAIPFFLLNLVTFGLAYGWAMKKTSSWIAPGLMHAASDLFLFIATLSNQ